MTDTNSRQAGGKNTGVYIYALKHPITNDIRYIGKANNPESRLKSHLSDSKKRNTPVYCWIRKLASAGLSPIMEVLEFSSNWEASEKLLISKYRITCNLLNVADGGNEPKCTKETRASNGLANAKKRDPLLWAASRKLGSMLYEAKKNGYKSIHKLEQCIFMFANSNQDQRLRMAKIITRGEL